MGADGHPCLLQIHDFAQLSEGVYYVYDDIERLRDEPRAVRVQGEEDVQVTEEVYRRPVFLLPAYRYHRLPLPADGAPLEEHFDAFIRFLRVRRGKAPAPRGLGALGFAFCSSVGMGGKGATPGTGWVLGVLLVAPCSLCWSLHHRCGPRGPAPSLSTSFPPRRAPASCCGTPADPPRRCSSAARPAWAGPTWPWPWPPSSSSTTGEPRRSPSKQGPSPGPWGDPGGHGFDAPFL